MPDDIVGSSGGSPSAVANADCRVTDALVAALAELGVRWAFGLVGGAIAPLCDSLSQSPIRCVASRHESGAVFQALEASLASSAPVAVYTTTGPGLVNAMNGLFAARVEGARVVIISGATSQAHRGRGAVQELSDRVLGVSSEIVRPACDFSVTLESPEQLKGILQRLAVGFARPGGFVAHIALPLGVQRALMARSPVCRVAPHVRPFALRDEDSAVLGHGPLVVWVGHGARHAAAHLRRFVEHTGALVMSTPHGKGIFPEDHPQYIGVTGFGGHPHVNEALRSMASATVVVLGSRLGEFSSIWDRSLLPARVIHVDVDDGAFFAGYPDVEVSCVVADVAAFCDAACERVPSRVAPTWTRPVRAALDLSSTGPVRPDRLMQVLQAEVVDVDDTLVFAEPGNSFAWATHHLRFSTPRYRMSGFWASMGHQAAGAIGAALAGGRRALVVTGDGSMLMNNEISTAAHYGARVMWVVLNDAAFGITEHGMRALGLSPLEPRFPRCDFAAVAQAMGARGFTVRTEDELESVLREARAVDGPTVVDVIIDGDMASPFIRRIEALRAMGAGG